MKTWSRTIPGSGSRGREFGRGFSLVELLAVIALIVLLLAIAVPATGSLLRSSERSLAENQLRVGIAAGRDAAIRSESGDGAAVFFYNEDNRLVIVPYVSAGFITDVVVDIAGVVVPNSRLRREVFVPVPSGRAVRLPAGWSVRGYADPGMIHAEISGKRNGWYDFVESMPATLIADGNWVFPETAMFRRFNAAGTTELTTAAEGAKRQTFLVRFSKQTGQVNTSNIDPVVVVDVAPTEQFRTVANSVFSNRRTNLAKAQNLSEMVRQIAAWSQYAQQPNPNVPSDVQRMLGDLASDTVLARPVTELALYEESRMAAAIGARGVNKRTQNLYGDSIAQSGSNYPDAPRIDTSLFPAGVSVEKIQKRINGWIASDPTADGNALVGAPFEARVFTLQRSLGQLQEIQP